MAEVTPPKLSNLNKQINMYITRGSLYKVMAALFYELRVGNNTDKIIFMPSKSSCPVN